MQNSQLERLLRLAQRTGDRLIITDAQGKRPVVILGLDEYETLLDGARLPSSDSRPPVIEEEEEVDLAKIEEAVAAVNKEFAPTSKAKGEKTDEGGEEQFYLEPV